MNAALSWLAHEPAVFLAFVAALGLAVGSFLNVVILRLPVMLKRSWQAECAEAKRTRWAESKTQEASR